jgi:hypothetical protein
MVYSEVLLMIGARSSVVVEALCYKPEGRGPRVDSASNRNEYQES